MRRSNLCIRVCIRAHAHAFVLDGAIAYVHTVTVYVRTSSPACTHADYAVCVLLVIMCAFADIVYGRLIPPPPTANRPRACEDFSDRPAVGSLARMGFIPS